MLPISEIVDETVRQPGHQSVRLTIRQSARPLVRALRRSVPCLLVAGTLAACAAPLPAGVSGSGARYQPAYAADFLAQTSWTLVRWSRPGGALRAVPKNDARDRPITLAFTHAGTDLRAGGFAGCNNYYTTYTVANGQLLFTANPVATRMACQPAERARLEQEYLAGLAQLRTTAVDNYENPGRLSLTLANGETLDFARADGAVPAQPLAPQ